MKSYISVNVVAQTLLLCQTINANKTFIRVEIPHVSFPYGINPDLALGFALQCDWVEDHLGVLEYTEIGEKIVTHFNGDYIDTILWRLILGQYIKTCSPAWAKRIPFGRKEAYLIMNAEEQRCFDEANLMDMYDEATIEWWDSLAELERAKSQLSLDDIGRKGERLTLLYEEKRTKSKPDWRSVETNLSGYDILSQRSETDKSNLLIEVKSSIQAIDEAYAIISRHEWDIAILPNNKERYLFYLWALSNHGNKLAVVSVDRMKPFIPVDSMSGKWETVGIPFSSFLEYFNTVTLEQEKT